MRVLLQILNNTQLITGLTITIHIGKYCIRVLVSGRVQGLFIRDSTRQQTNRLGLAGHATNLPNGCVEVLACGDSHSLDELVRCLNEGPQLTRVSHLHVITVMIPMVDDFSIG